MLFLGSALALFSLSYLSLIVALIGVIFLRAQAYAIMLIPAVILAFAGFLSL